MQELSTLEGKTLAELREIGKVLGITDSSLKKKDLLKAIAAVANAEDNVQPVPCVFFVCARTDVNTTDSFPFVNKSGTSAPLK